MTWVQWVIGSVGVLVMAGVLAGLLIRGRWRSAPVFTSYLAFITAMDAGCIWWPAVFYTHSFWFLREIGIALLRFGVTLEVARWIFRGFPNAERTLKNTLLLVLGITLVGGIAWPPQNPSYETLVGEAMPRIANGTVWLLTAISGLVLWYRLPLEPIQKAILIGLAPYLIVFTVARGLWISSAQRWRDELGYLETVAFVVVEVYWLYAAWRTAEHPTQARVFAPAAVQANAGGP